MIYDGKPDLSVVLLCYHSEEATLSYVEGLRACLVELNISWEVILVANYFPGSGDRTPEVARDIANKDVRVKALTEKKKGMMGWDMKCGLKNASGKFIAITDGDGQFPLDDVGRVYKKITDENLDMAKTYRVKRGDGLYRRFLSAIYNVIFMFFFPGFRCQDVNSKPKIFRAEVLEKMDLLSDDWFIDAEIMIQARRLKLRFAEISTQFSKLDTRTSFIKPGAIIEFVVNMILFRFREYRYLFKK